jgi:DNA-directed RNA polymerase specialized sigma24 family protein
MYLVMEFVRRPRLDHRHGELEVVELVKAAAEGENAAWKKLVERYAGLVWLVARGCGLNTAEATTVSQTTWLRLVQHLGTLRHPERLGHWLAVTARHECLRIVGQADRLPPADDSDSDVGGGSIEAHEPDLRLATTERSAQLWEAFVELQPRCQQLLWALLVDSSLSSNGMQGSTGAISPTRVGCLKSFRQKLATIHL